MGTEGLDQRDVGCIVLGILLGGSLLVLLGCLVCLLCMNRPPRGQRP